MKSDGVRQAHEAPVSQGPG